MSAIDEIMAQAQVFASAWSLVGGRFDDGSGLEVAEKRKAELRDLIAAALADSRSYGAMEAQQRMFPCCGGNDESPAEHCMDCETRVLPTGPRQPEPPDPLDMPLPCDIKIGHGTHSKGTTLRTLVNRTQMLYDMAHEQPLVTTPTIADVRRTISDIRLNQLQELLERGRPTGLRQAVRLTKDEIKAACAKIAEQVARNCGSVPQLTFPHIYLGVEDLLKANGMGDGNG